VRKLNAPTQVLKYTQRCQQ